MADDIAKVAVQQVKNLMSTTSVQDLIFEMLRVTLDGASATIYCNHKSRTSINTAGVRKALFVLSTPSKTEAMAADVLQAGAVISTTTYTNDTVTVHGLTTGIYDVLIIGTGVV